VLELSAQSSGANSAGGTNSEQCLVTKALGKVTEMTWLKLLVRNPAEFRLSESSDKAMSAKYAYQAKLERPRTLNLKEIKRRGFSMEPRSG